MGHTSLRTKEKQIENLSEFKQLFNEHKKPVFAVALSVLRDFELAEDVLQDVFIKLFQQMNQTEITNVKAWLIRVARNTALDAYRKKKRELTGFDEGYFEKEQYPTGDPTDKMVLAKYLEILDSEERQIIIMKDISGLKHREIATIIGIPLGTVLWKYNMAMKKLRKSLK